MCPVRRHLYYDIQDQVYCVGHVTHGEIEICVSHVLKHFLRSTPKYHRSSHKEGGQSISFLRTLRS